jgi:hypothetical protein
MKEVEVLLLPIAKAKPRLITMKKACFNRLFIRRYLKSFITSKINVKNKITVSAILLASNLLLDAVFFLIIELPAHDLCG